MKVPLSWLRDYVAIDVPLPELLERLVLAGLEVDGVLDLGAPDVDSNHELFLIGRVVEQGQHPNADRLRLCQVDVGEADLRQIVCGARNFEAGDTVVVALPGARLPGATEPLRAARLRGAASDGMMLSERELQLSAEHDGIIVLPDGYDVGSLLADHVALAETVLDLAVTANRPDLLSVYGIAREVSTLLDVELAPMPGREPEARGSRPVTEVVSVAIDAPERCFRFTARAFDDVRIGPSPLRIRQRLAAAGVRPLTNVVDATNYVMVGLGQPLHAYDGDRIPGRRLTARMAAAGEQLTTLDGRRRELTPDMLVIADRDGPNGLAGVMGGADSEITDATSTVVLEAACFERSGISRTSAALGLRTDGSTRWTRGVDPHLAPAASRWAAELIVGTAGAAMCPGVLDEAPYLPERPVVRLRDGRAGEVLGTPVAVEESQRVLGRLGYEPRRVGEAIETTVPTWRWLDTTREIDLVEEVGRIAALGRLPATLPAHADAAGGLTRAQALRRRVEDVLAGVGLHEALTVSLVEPGHADGYGLAPDDPRRATVALSDPLTSEHAELRTTIVPSLLRALRRNRSAGRTDVGLFEIAHVYQPVAGELLPREPWTLAAVLGGRLGGSGWTGAGRGADLFTIKGMLETLAARLGVAVELRPFAPTHLHPGRAAEILVRGERAGELGELHPAVAERLDLDGRVAVLELDLDLVAAAAPATAVYAEVPEQPPVRQDIAVVVDRGVAAADVVAVALEAGAPLLVSARVFDVYRDDARLGAERVSLAVRLVFQHPERTLTEAEASEIRERIVAALRERVGAELRT